MRLFIAVRLNEEMKDALIDAQNQMYDAGVRGNYTSEENLHLTLAFIGEYPNPQDVLDAMGEVSFSPFRLSLDGFGNFGDLWWAGLEESAAIQAVTKRLRRALADRQIPFDSKKFKAHITLLRKAKAEHVVPPVNVHRTTMQVHTISLMKSERGKNGMIYTEIGTIEA